jgi:hypothetical protein
MTLLAMPRTRSIFVVATEFIPTRDTIYNEHFIAHATIFRNARLFSFR